MARGVSCMRCKRRSCRNPSTQHRRSISNRVSVLVSWWRSTGANYGTYSSCSNSTRCDPTMSGVRPRWLWSISSDWCFSSRKIASDLLLLLLQFKVANQNRITIPRNLLKPWNLLSGPVHPVQNCKIVFVIKANISSNSVINQISRRPLLIIVVWRTPSRSGWPMTIFSNGQIIRAKISILSRSISPRWRQVSARRKVTWKPVKVNARNNRKAIVTCNNWSMTINNRRRSCKSCTTRRWWTWRKNLNNRLASWTNRWRCWPFDWANLIRKWKIWTKNLEQKPNKLNDWVTRNPCLASIWSSLFRIVENGIERSDSRSITIERHHETSRTRSYSFTNRTGRDQTWPRRTASRPAEGENTRREHDSTGTSASARSVSSSTWIRF